MLQASKGGNLGEQVAAAAAANDADSTNATTTAKRMGVAIVYRR